MHSTAGDHVELVDGAALLQELTRLQKQLEAVERELDRVETELRQTLNGLLRNLRRS